MNEYQHKVLGCYLGKAVGGTLGQPYEGCEGPLALTFYDPVPTDMIPNDDLDLQVLWACRLAERGNGKVDYQLFADAWKECVAFPWDEYGLAIRNLRLGIPPPLCGRYDNFFRDGLGAAIRSEIWACLAPENPAGAAELGRLDALCDHIGDGAYAEIFLCALESAAFSPVATLDAVIAAGLAEIPSDCRLAQAIRQTIAWCQESRNPLEVRAKILQHYGSNNFTDVVMNIPFMIMALLLGDGDFGRSICMAVNCGMDADCTGATVGAILGLLNPDSIPEAWLRPIGRKLVLNDAITNIQPPTTLDGFAKMIEELKAIVTVDHAAVAAAEALSDQMEQQQRLPGIDAECAISTIWLKLDSRKYAPVMATVPVKRHFPGCRGRISASEVPKNRLYLMRFSFTLEHDQAVRILFNTPANCRVWVDGDYAFGREGGTMVPSFHRVPTNQFCDRELTAGTHEILVGIAPMSEAQTELEWIIGVGSLPDMQFLPFAMQHKLD